MHCGKSKHIDQNNSEIIYSNVREFQVANIQSALIKTCMLPPLALSFSRPSLLNLSDYFSHNKYGWILSSCERALRQKGASTNVDEN